MFTFLYTDQLQYTILAINFFAFATLFVYALYLFKVERKIKHQTHKLDNDARKIVEDANKKALEIITRSQYLSDTIKAEIKKNFEDILSDLAYENESFYKDLESKYIKSSEKFVHKIENEGETDIKNFANTMIHNAQQAEDKIESAVSEKYAQAEKEIEEFKNKKKQEFETEMLAKINKITKELIPSYLSAEDNIKLVKEAIEKAYSEKFFDKNG